ncbi:hypothetical protein AGMMS49965_18380 [Bacteroidia bacterium]|nr:hypothetical protein AGMMS49965_18380 [Bacteroidia bacterium]
MKKVMNLVVAALATIAVSSCAGGGGSNSPADIEKSIYSQFQKGNFEKGMELYFDNIENNEAPNPDASDERQKVVKEFAQKAKQTVEAKGGIKDFEVLEEAIAEDGETAMVKSKTTYGDGSEQSQSSKYVKKDGQWKIVFGK